MSESPTMDCLEFKRLTLIDPRRHDQHADHGYLTHASDCVDCHEYLQNVLKLDNQLRDSVDVSVPADLVAKLKLNQELSTPWSKRWQIPHTVAASLAAAVLVVGLLGSGVWSTNPVTGEDYEILIAAVMEHMHEVPTRPVWSKMCLSSITSYATVLM